MRDLWHKMLSGRADTATCDTFVVEVVLEGLCANCILFLSYVSSIDGAPIFLCVGRKRLLYLLTAYLNS